MVRKIGRFRLRVFILIFLLSLTTMVFYTALATNQITVIQKQQIHEEMQKSALAIQVQVDQNMQNAKRILSILARAYSEDPDNIKSFNKITQEIIEDVPIITQVYIMNTDGMQIYKSSFPETMGDRSDRDYFQAAIRGEIVFSDVIVSRSTNVPIAVHAQPLVKDGEIIGVIGASIDLG
nr:cache domain-containing protein [Clostridia bacterium]